MIGSAAPTTGTPDGTSHARVLVLLNPRAGGGRALSLRPAFEAVVAADPRAGSGAVALQVPESVAAAESAIAALPPASRVVVVGGDGSLGCLLPALLRGRHELGVVPAGSGNDTARALGLVPLPPEAALRRALEGRARPVDVGMARLSTGGDDVPLAIPFLSSLTAGFDSAVGRRAAAGPAWLRGLPRYLIATLRELAVLHNRPVRVRVDGRDWHAGPVLFASTLNTATYASGMPCVPHASIHDGRLDLLVAGPFSRPATLVMLPRLLLGRHLGHARVRTVGAATITLTADEPIPIAADGEYQGSFRLIDICLLPGGLPVVHAD